MNSVCSHERLELALAGLLSADNESSLHLHLEECASCSAEMELLAGGERVSKEIASMLTPDDLDEGMPLREEWSTADFVVEHLEPSDDRSVLGRLGSYDVLDVIGRGGMGVVLKGFDRELKRFVAIKALAPHLAHSALARKRFAREAQAAAAVVSPHVIAIHQVQPNGQLPFLVMPLLTGESLAQRITVRGTLELKEVLRIGMQAAEGLAVAHGQGLIHRDIKPANILLDKGVDRAVLTDFGLARAADDVSMTRWGIIAGTPEYMSPEQARGEALDGRSDLFSLGCVMYEMATGVSPFRADSTMATLRRIVDEKPVAMASLAPDLLPWFIGIVERLLSKNPDQRFSSASEVSALLEQCLSHIQQPASAPLPPFLAHLDTSRRSIFTTSRKKVIGLLGAIVIAILAIVYFQRSEAHDIAGRWIGEEWGTVDFEVTQPGQYQGKLTGADKGKLGSVNVKWSRFERRFNGTWSDGNKAIGRISLRPVGGELRGAFSTAKNSPKESGFPRLGEFAWTRDSETSSAKSSLLSDKKTTFLKHPDVAKANVAASPKFDARVFVYREEPISTRILDHNMATQEIVLGIGAIDRIQIGHAFSICVPDTPECVGVAKVIELEAQRCIARVVSMDSEKAPQDLKGLTAVCAKPKLNANKIVVECGLGKLWPIESLENLVIRKMLESGGDQVQVLVRQESSGKFVYGVRPPQTAMTRSVNNIKQILLAMHRYSMEHGGRFPPAVIDVVSNDGKSKTPHSWRVELLPYLENGAALYAAYQFNEPWDSDANKKLLSQMPPEFRDPSADPESTSSAYYVLVGGGDQWMKGDATLYTAFSTKDGIRFSDILDGTSNTIAVVEAKRNIPWTKPEDIHYDPGEKPPKLGGFHDEGFNAGMCDGSVKLLARSISEESFRAFVSPTGRENVNLQLEVSTQHADNRAVARVATYALKKKFQAKDTAGIVAKALPDLGLCGSVEIVADEQKNSITVRGDDASQKIILEQLSWIDPDVKELPQSGPTRDP